ncbi:MAG: helix-turn-helix transcriptional regulator [Spirochaetota bacterium]|jgi:putative transcriptional regulator|nr:helix-turn-helix transcriptional regulator [Spirochaetota bacterium]
MLANYRKLWKILIDKDMKKKDLVLAANISWTSVTKMSKGENVSMNILMKVCEALDCNIGDIVEFERDDTT